MKKITKVFLFLILSKKRLSKPKENKILIFDATNYYPIIKILGSKEIDILHTRGEVLNFYLLTKVILRKFYLIFYPSLFWREYIFYYIDAVDPKVILTFIDNNPFFYTLKKKYSSKIFLSLQNGYRFNKGDIFGNLDINSKKKLMCDYIFCFNKKVAKLYERFIKCKTVVIGSLKNNLTRVSNKNNSNKILLISSFGLKSENIEKKLISILTIYCKNKNFKLIVLGRTGKKSETNFYENINKDKSFQYLRNKGAINHEDISYSYKIIDNSDTIISLNATLGYEALGRGKKTIFFNFNKREKNCKSYITYNWPNKFSKEGFNWLAVYNEKKILKKLDSICKLSNKEWERKYKKEYSLIMPVDNQNKKLKKILNKFI